MRSSLTVLLFVAIFPVKAFSQDYEDSRARLIRETRETFVREQMELSLRQLEANRFDPLNADRRFIASVPKFRETVEEYRMTMSLEGSSRKSLKEMDQFVGDFRKYFQETKVEGDFPDPAEFRDFTTEELSWETLTSAERVDTKLRQASLLIQQANVSNVVNIKAMLFLRGLDSELRRLHLLISKLKVIPG